MQLFSHGIGGCQRPKEKVHRQTVNQKSSRDNEYLGFSLMV